MAPSRFVRWIAPALAAAALLGTAAAQELSPLAVNAQHVMPLALNPQPLPPRISSPYLAINPQPLPPRNFF